MLRTSDLEYVLPEDRVALSPAEPRDSARLMVVWRSDPGRVEHRTVRDLPDYLGRGDALIVNNTRVLAARLLGVRTDTGGAVEGLFLSEYPTAATGLRWRVLLRGRRMRAGLVVALNVGSGPPSGVQLRLVRSLDDEGEKGGWVVEVEGSGAGEATVAGGTGGAVLERVGTTPLPPYIRAARRRASRAEDEAADRDRYQTVYSDAALAGSVAAPTAGLHFTPELLSKLAAGGVTRGEVLLHVGTGTFKPVETEFVEQHPMHAEWCRVPASTGGLIARTRAAGGRVVAVGTTSARTLESFSPAEIVAGAEAWTRLLVTPGFAWRNVDGLMTNFHLPRSTLLAMVASLLPEGMPRLLDLYADAIGRGYRFYSFGDAMLVLP